MKIKCSKKSIALGRLLLASCLMLGLTSAFAAAAEEKHSCIEAELQADFLYGTLKFCIPEDVIIEAESIDEADYTGGREVASSLLLDGDRVGLHLLYPCAGIKQELNRDELKGLLEAYNPILAEIKYNDSFPEPAVWGQLANQIIVSYQPNNQTVVLLLLDTNMSDTLMTDFLDNLSIRLNENVTPLTSGYCPDTTTSAPAEETAAGDSQETATASGTDAKDTAAATESASDQPVTGKDKMSTDINAAKEQIEKLKKSM